MLDGEIRRTLRNTEVNSTIFLEADGHEVLTQMQSFEPEIPENRQKA
jgi:hypothetical protein